MKKKLMTAAAAAALVLGAGTFGYHWWTFSRFIESTDNAYVQGDISIVSPRLVGYVRDVKVSDNQQVKAGDVLATLDDRDYAARVAQAKAAMDAQAANVASIGDQINQQQAMVAQAQANLTSTEADRSLARQDLERYKTLSDQGVVSQQKFEAATANSRKADAGITKAQAGLSAERARLPVLEGQRKGAEAQLAQAKATLELAQIDLDNTVIRAPVDGVVGNRSVQVGRLVRVGEQLMSVVPLNSVYIVANFKETQLSHMRPGQMVKISIDAFPNHDISGRVESFSPASGSQFSLLPPENATGNFTKIVQRVPVRVVLPSSDSLSGYLRPGLSATAKVDTRPSIETASLGDFFSGSAYAAQPQQK